MRSWDISTAGVLLHTTPEKVSVVVVTLLEEAKHKECDLAPVGSYRPRAPSLSSYVSQWTYRSAFPCVSQYVSMHIAIQFPTYRDAWRECQNLSGCLPKQKTIEGDVSTSDFNCQLLFSCDLYAYSAFATCRISALQAVNYSVLRTVHYVVILSLTDRADRISWGSLGRNP